MSMKGKWKSMKLWIKNTWKQLMDVFGCGYVDNDERVRMEEYASSGVKSEWFNFGNERREWFGYAEIGKEMDEMKIKYVLLHDEDDDVNMM